MKFISYETSLLVCKIEPIKCKQSVNIEPKYSSGNNIGGHFHSPWCRDFPDVVAIFVLLGEFANAGKIRR